MSKKTVHRVVVVDDHPIMRQGLCALIAAEPDLSVCGEAESAESAMEVVPREKPDLVIADITLPGRNGIELIKDLHSVVPEIPVLVLSMHDEAIYAERVLRVGGRGYVMKQEGGLKLMEAIRKVLSGQVYVSESTSARILESMAGGGRREEVSSVSSLTDRELEVFEMFGKGLGTREIAQKLHLSVKTVEVHRSNIKRKLGLDTANALVRYAVRWVESEGD